MKTAAPTMVNFVKLLVPIAVLLAVLVETAEQQRFRCGDDQVCERRGYVACVDEDGPPKCKDCWRMADACGTVNQHIDCTPYCQDIIRQDEKKKCDTELRKINQTFSDVLEEKDSTIQKLQVLVRQYKSNLDQWQEQQNVTKLTVLEYQMGNLIQTEQSSNTTECSIFSHWLVVAETVMLCITLPALVICVVIMVHLYMRIRKYRSVDGSLKFISSTCTSYSILPGKDDCNSLQNGITPERLHGQSGTEAEENLPESCVTTRCENVSENENMHEDESILNDTDEHPAYCDKLKQIKPTQNDKSVNVITAHTQEMSDVL